MFSFMSMANNYEERKVDRYEADGLIIDTCAVTDSDQPYETGVSHHAYNNGDWVIVELYPTREAAQAGHKKWVEKMTAKELPKSLVDVGTAEVKKLGEALGVDFENEKVRNY